LRLQEVWEFRDLLLILVRRDIQLRYKQTALGVAWALLQPVLTMIVFTIIAKLAKIPSDHIAYPVFVFCGLLPWQLFSQTLNESSNSLVANSDLITKVYFPRLVMPLAAILAGLVDFAISFVLLVGMMIYFGITPTLMLFTVPLFVLLAVATALAVGLWLSALNVEYRDVRYTIPFLTQFWLFATPVFYPASLIPEKWRPFCGLNPMAGVVEGFRWALLGADAPGPLLGVSVITVAVLLVGGLIYFRRMGKTFAEIV